MIVSDVPKPIAPAFLDIVIGEWQDVLKENLLWLDKSFGKSQKLVKIKEGREFSYPAIFISRDEYISVLPCADYGNTSFFLIKDPQLVNFNKHAQSVITVNYGLIFWLNLAKIYPSSEDRNLETIKAEILGLLTRGPFTPQGSNTVLSSLSVTEIEEEFNNIYAEYNVKEVQSQYLMHPYAGLRFNGELVFKEPISCP